MADKKLKLIWDFFGGEGLKTAKHHAIHLKEFCQKEKITFYACGSEQQEQHAEAYLVVDEEQMIPLRDALRPKRGEWVDQ